jgi:hypothetical protein
MKSINFLNTTKIDNHNESFDETKTLQILLMISEIEIITIL